MGNCYTVVVTSSGRNRSSGTSASSSTNGGTCILVTALLSCRLVRKVLSFSRFQTVFRDGTFLSKMRFAFRGGDGTFLISKVFLT